MKDSPECLSMSARHSGAISDDDVVVSAWLKSECWSAWRRAVWVCSDCFKGSGLLACVEVSWKGVFWAGVKFADDLLWAHEKRAFFD